MFTGYNRRAFTLLEVMMAVAILAMVSFSIYRFLEVNIRAITYSSAVLESERRLEGLVGMLDSQIKSLPVNARGALTGEAFRFKGASADELQWKATAGNGLFTAHAAAEYDVTLAIIPVDGMEGFQLGLRRELADESSEEINWLPLIDRIAALEIRYFDPRLNDWVERWSDDAARPALIRVRIWPVGDELPYEAVIRMPSTRMTTNAPNV